MIRHSALTMIRRSALTMIRHIRFKKCTLVLQWSGTFMFENCTLLLQWSGILNLEKCSPELQWLGMFNFENGTLVLQVSSYPTLETACFVLQYIGIFNFENCTWMSTWNAYLCNDSVRYSILSIESMDHDTETRRLSPVAVYSGGYIDLLNGPQDQGWCSGYTCRKRLSLFPAIVPLGECFWRGKETSVCCPDRLWVCHYLYWPFFAAISLLHPYKIPGGCFYSFMILFYTCL